MEFERTLEDELRDELAPVLPVVDQVREKLQGQRAYPVMIYLHEANDQGPVGSLLTELYGVRGNRIPLLITPGLTESFRIRWGA